MSTQIVKAKGYLEVIKIFPDGHEEVHWEDNNVITSGMGLGFSFLLGKPSELSAGLITNFQIKYYQLGVSGSTNYGVSTHKLTSSLAYSDLSGFDLPIVSALDQLSNGQILTSQSFFEIGQANIHRTSPTSVRYHLIIPASELNNLSNPLNEVGLFMRNPLNRTPEAPILVAYKYFSPILKTSEFALLFRWSLYF
jgi:hypothetical protein